MSCDTVGERHDGSNKTGALGPVLLEDLSLRCDRVEVEGDLELLNDLPEDIPLGSVVKHRRVTIGSGALVIVDEGSNESEFLDTASELGGGLLGSVHGEGGEG